MVIKMVVGLLLLGCHVAAEVSVIVVLSSNSLRFSAVCNFGERGKWRRHVSTFLI